MSNTEQDPSTKSPVKHGDLPPLGPTAEVPAIHSDTLNNPQYWTNKYEGKTATVPRKERDDRLTDTHTGIGWRKPAAAGALALTIAAGAFGIGMATSGNDTNTEPRVEPSVGAPANPGETVTVQTDYGIDAEKYTSPEAVVGAYVNQQNKWFVDGATLENYQADDYTLSRPDYAAELAVPGNELYTEALYIDGWQNNATLAQSIETHQAVHQETLDVYLFTVGSGDSRDREPYHQWLEFDEVNILEASSDSITASIRYQYRDNSDMNRAMDYLSEEVENSTGGQIITWAIVDNRWKISDIQPNV